MNIQRIKKLREKIAEKKLDALIITNQADRDYLLGIYPQLSGFCIVTLNDLYFLAGSIYYEAAKDMLKGIKVNFINKGSRHSIEEIARKEKISKIGIESQSISHAQYEEFKKIKGAKLVDTSGMVEELRMVKDNTEIEKIRKASDISSFVFSRILNVLKPGIREKEVNDEMESIMRKAGAELAFESIVASGKRSVYPHGLASDKRLMNGDAVVLDFGAKYDGYCSDMTRTIFIGRAGIKEKKVYSVVKGAQEHAISKIKDGATSDSIDMAARRIINKKGYGKYFVHSTGHGVGLVVHDKPSLNKGNKTILKQGMVVTVEPGIYIPGMFGVRIEDTVLIKKNGCDVLTRGDKELTII